MTDQPKQDAIVSQGDYDMANQLEETEWPGNHAAWTHIIAQHFATYRAETEAATIERCARAVEALRQIELISTNHGGWFENDAWKWGQHMGEIARTAIRNLKGQTS